MNFEWLIRIIVLFDIICKSLCSSGYSVRNFNDDTIDILHRILVRKKRFVVFSNYASMKITAIVGKHLIARYPRQMNLSLEVSLYYALPTKLEEWYPKSYRSSTTPKPAVTKQMKYSKSRIFDIQSNESQSWRRTWLPHKYDLDGFMNYKYKYPKSEYNSDHKQIYKIVRANRDRRDFYNHLEETGSSYGFKVRDCVLRMICEVKHYLFPRGYSLFQDVIRIFFTFPTMDHMDDIYSSTIRDSQKNCKDAYGKFCPVSVLEFMLRPQKFTKDKQQLF